ncbi:MAG: imidazolonepropionase [Muribaculaceae bacterium]|nr:imidazolonepropionase [Muribaculaceae bacterium]
MSRLRIYNATIVTPEGRNALKGSEMTTGVKRVPDAEIVIEDGVITAIGPSRGNLGDSADIDAKGRVVVPGFVDSHTHPVFGGWRPEEFGWRLRGDSYMSIMNRGGGIVSTMRATREATEEVLRAKTLALLDRAATMGVTTMEAKSGYGLDLDSELLQLQVIASLSADPSTPVTLTSTFLGAHAVPPEWAGNPDGYIDYIISDVLPRVKEKGLAESVDIFCEEGVFSVEQSRRLLKAAREMGFTLKIHADEIVTTGGAELAAELGALSADHLLHASDAGIDALARSGVVATLLPLTAFTLREPFARARQMIDSGCAVALATDLNPGSCCSGSIPLTFALACIYMNMSIEEAITAMTLNGAAAIGRADTIGSIEVGKRGDIVMLDADTPDFLPYFTGMNIVAMTVNGGRVVYDNRAAKIVIK